MSTQRATHHIDCDGAQCHDWECTMCECCHFEFEDPISLVLILKRQLRPIPRKRELMRVCDLCYETDMLETPHLSAVAFIGNRIVRELRHVNRDLKWR